MCDCFHLAFPNWHAPAAGAGRRLRGPEQEEEDDSVCEEPEILEKERPRPQGSSPVEEFPVEKQDMQSDESEMIVKTVKEACVEGLVVTGGGKEGIFIKEVKLDSPASKHLSVKEGDQILSATVYFDNVSYEDALHILEHAQPYKMEFCLRRKMEPSIPENAEIIHTKEKEQGPPMMRSQRKMKKQQERISWPKFPSFGKGPRVQFKRSHSTSEAEEHRKLEMSPPTSDAESPLKCPDGKDKKKKHKVQLKMKMKGHRSKSVEEPQRNEQLVWENQQVEYILEEKVLERHEEQMQEIPQVLSEAENEVSSKTGTDDPFQSLSAMERHEAHLISLGNTLKTTDISVALAEGGKIESSEMNIRIHQKEKPDIGTENQVETIKALYTISDPSACDNILLSQAEVEISQFDNDLNRQGTEKDSSGKKMESGNVELSMPNLDTCVEVTKKSPRIGDEKQWKEMFENESYGIRTRGPLADMATSKTHFVSTVNGLQFISPDFSEITQVGKMSDGISDTKKPTVTFLPKPGSADLAGDKEYSPLEIKTCKLPTETTDFILVDLDRRSASKFKLPKVDGTGFVTHELIKMTAVEKNTTHLPKREDIEIPGMENKETKPSLQTPEIKVPKIEKIINVTKQKEIQDLQTEEEFNVEDVKVAVSKFPAFKLPEGDITGVLVQREITIMELKTDKSMLTPRGSPHKTSITSTDSSTSYPKSKVGEEKSPASDIVDKGTAIKMPKVELRYTDEHTSTALMKIDHPQITDYGRCRDINFKLPKREDIEIPGMEAIKESQLQNTVKVVSDTDLNQPEKPKTKKYGDKKGHEKKSKKPKISIQGFEITKSDIECTDISTELPKKDSSKMDTGETKIHEKHKFKTPKIGEVENKDVPVQETKILEDNMDNGTDINEDGQSANVYGRAQDTETEGQGRKFKLPKFEISFPEVKAPRISCTSKKDDDSSISEESGKVPVVHSAKAELPEVKPELSTDLPEIDSEITEVKIKRPGFSFPRFGISKSEHTAPAADVSRTNVDMSLPDSQTVMEDTNTNIAISVKEGKQKDATKFGSPTKFKIPSIKFPSFGAKVTKAAMETSDVHVGVKRADTSLPDTELKLSAEPIIETILVDIKDPDVDKQKKSVSMESINMDIQNEAQVGKFKLPQFGISDLEIKGPKVDVSSDKAEIDISVPKAKVEVQPPDVELQGLRAEIKADLPEIDSKDLEVKIKTPGFSFPTTGFRKSDIKASEGDVSLPNFDVSLHEGSIEMERPTTDVTTSLEDGEQKDPIKFKLPSVTFPKFGAKGPKGTLEVSDVGVDVKGPEISLPDAEIKLSSEPLSVNIKGPGADKERKSLSMEMKDQDIQIKEQGSKFKLPKFGISLPDVKGPKIDISSDKTEIDISVPKAKVEVHPPDVELQGLRAEIKADLPEVDSKDLEVKMKTPGFSFPRSGFSKTEIKAPKGDVGLPNVDVALPEGSIEIERPTTDVTIPMEEAEQKEPTKFKMPSINFPKFGTKGPKATIEVSDVNVDVKGPEISLPDAEIKLSAEPISVGIKGPDADKEMKSLSMDMKDQDIQIKEQGSTFKLPKFGINVPEIKGPKIDISSDKAEIDISVPKAKVEVHPANVEVEGVTAEIKAELPEVDSKDLEVKMKTPGFSFPRIGFSKSEVKAPEGDVSLPNVDLPLPEGIINIERPTTDITIPMEEAEQKGRSKFGSPTKFKLPSINFPKFGTKGPKATVELSDVNVDVKGPEVSLPDAEIKLSAEPISVDIKGPDADKEMKSLSMDMKDQDIQIKEQGSTFKLPKFGINVPEIKGPKIDVSSDKAEIDISVPKAKVEVHPPDVEVEGVMAKIKADLPEVDSQDLEVKMKTPGFSFPRIGFSKSEVKAPEGDVSLPNVDVPLPEGSIEIERPTTDVTIPMEDAEQKDRSKFGSPTKFKLPSINFPKFGTKGPKATVEVSDVNVDIKGPDISLPDAEIKLSAEPISVDIKGPDADKEMKSLSMDMKDQDIQIKEQGSKFKLPKFGISVPELKGPKIDVSSDKAKIDISVPKAKVEVHPPNVEVEGVTAEIKADLPEVDSKDIEVKMKTPGFSFPRIGFSKSEVKAPEGDVSLPNVDVPLPEGSIEFERPTTDVTIPMEEAEQKGRSKFGSPTKFKMPSINFPKFGTKGPKATIEVSDVNVDVKGTEVSLPDAEIKLSAEPISVDIKGPDADKEMKSLSMDMKDQDIQIKEQGSKFKLPKFGISVPELKGPKIDISSDKPEIDISVPKAKVEMHPPDVKLQKVTAEIKADLPEVDSQDLEVKMKTPGFSFPRIGFSKSEVKAPEGDVSLPNVDVSLPEGSIEIERPTTDVTIPMEDAEQKDRSKFGSPTKFKLPSINFPKFGTKGPKATVEVSDVNVDIKGPDISLPDAEIKLSAEPISVDIKGPDADKEMKSLSMDMKDQDIQIKEQGSKFKLPKFGISVPEIKGPKIDVSPDKANIDISVPKAKVEIHPPEVEVQKVTAEIKADLPEVDSKDLEVKMKTPGFSFPRIGFSKSEVKAPEGDVSLPNVDVSLPEGSIEIERPTTDVTIPMEDAEQKDRSKFGSPTKFKLPSINFPKFGTKGPKATVEVSDVNVDIKGPDISLPDAEIKLSAEPISVDIKGPDADKEMKSLSMDMKDQDIQIKEQGSKFKLPKFGISVPELKGPKIDVSSDKAKIDISVPKAKVEVHPPNVEVEGVTAEIKADLPEVDSKDTEVKMKTPGFSFPRIGFSKSEVKAPEGDVSLPNVDVPLPEGSIEFERPTTDVTIPMEEAEQKGRSKFGSPTKFKMPSINFPKFGTKGPKATIEVSDVNVDVKGPEVSLPDAEIKLSAEPISVDIKGPDADKEMKSLSMDMKDQDIQIKEQGSKFKLPKFGISVPELKGPKIDISSDKAEIDISLPKAKVEMHPPDVKLQKVKAEIKADLPEVDSQDLEVKMKTPGFSFPRIGFSKSEVKAPEGDVSLPNVDVSLPEGSIEIERPTTDVTIPMEDAEQKDRSKFGSPTKFKLPSINFPKFGTKGPKATVEVSDVNVDIKGPDISLPDAEIKLSAEPISVDIKGPDADKEMKSLSMDMKDQDIQIKEQGSKFKLPKFGISVPELKGPKIDVSSDKAKIDISVPKAKVEVHPPNVEVEGVTAEIKADLPEVDSKDIEVKMKTPGFSFPRIGFSKSEVKAPEGDVSLPNVDVPLPEGSIEFERPTTDVTIPMEEAEQKGRSKFGSPTKFKMPSINFPKFGTKGPKATIEVSDVNVDVKGPEVSLPDAEIKLSAEPISVDIKGPDADKEMKSLSMDMKDQDIQIKEQGSKFKLPKFGISVPELKGPKIDISSDKAEIDISVPKAKVEIHPPDVEVQKVTAEIKADLPEVDSQDLEVKMKTPGFSFPRIGFSKSEVKAPEGDVSLPNVDVALPEGSMEMERPTTNVTIPVEEAEQKGRSKFGSPTKFKMPSINFPKFGTKGPKATIEVSDVNVDVKGPEISLPDAEIKLSAEPISVGIKGPDADKEMKSLSMDMKDQDIQIKEQGSKFKLPKFEISIPEVKGPKIDVSSDKANIDISVPKAKVEVHPSDVEVEGVTAEIKADLPEVDSQDLEVKMKTPGFSFPRIGFSKSEVKAPEGDVSLPNVDVSLPEGSIEIERPTTDVTIPMEEAEQKGRSKFGSPTKFKMPSINFPKFGTKGPKAAVEVSDVNVDIKGPEISLPDAEIKLSAEPISVDIKGPDADQEMKSLSMDMKDQDVQIKEQGSKFKLPKFGISLPDVKGPKFVVSSDKEEIDISVPKAKVEVHPPDVEVQKVTTEIKADLPEVESQELEVKMKRPGLSFPRFSKSDSKTPASDLSSQTADVSLPEESIKIEVRTTDIIDSMEIAGQKDPTKSSSQTKLKLPSIKLPKFGVKSSVRTDVKGREISLPDEDLSAESLSMDITGHDVDKDENFVIAQPEVKGSEVKIQYLNVKVNNVEINNEVTIPELDSQVGKCGDEDTPVNDALDVVLEPKQKYTQRVKTSSKFKIPALGDVFSGFEVEFNVPKFDEIEESMKPYSDPLKHEQNIAVSGHVSTECVSKCEDGEAQEKSKTDQNKEGGQKQTQPENSDWFRFPKFSSPTKTAKDNEKFISQLPKKAEHSPQSDINENESKKSFTREIDEDNVSPTLSLSSSDAFADISSALTTEQIDLSLASPTKVKVKYSEPTPNAEVSGIHGDIITSTARTKLISMEPHQPEKVNIPFSSETSSSSVDTLKQMSGHIVVSNVKSVSKTEHATVLTKVDTQDTQTLPPEKVADSMLSVEETIMRKGHTIVEKHVVKEIFGDDKEKIFVTQRIQVFDGDSTEPISDDTASSIQKLRETVHTEKIRFFEGAESSKTILMSTETLLRHVDSSTDENEGK
ncbi:neuroblast differentiation-associated protein AHNAK-like isoform X2 [Ictalurus punctatus]|uniref:Neuroblast differentiation-associated protein AHNAK-like isoform X2 n=1 Tax=Ictalurus punctatus TaxID=7998 RepID=A0A979ERR6_ICTPU|nr:neuroblast differentiation-associated protein AHNAK-like isoform X2 [Ictalurus punctatus]